MDEFTRRTAPLYEQVQLTEDTVEIRFHFDAPIRSVFTIDRRRMKGVPIEQVIRNVIAQVGDQFLGDHRPARPDP